MFSKRQLCAAIAVALSSYLSPTRAEIEEIVVTATKQAASTQDIPIAVSAVTEESLNQLGVANFSDYLIQLPGVTAGGSGPGQNTIYIRGVASTTPNLTTAGVAGLAPNVAFYLDEQPLSQPGRNLDVYAADLNRVEVLAGPQGTLFGASSQAGTVRLITNKPDPSGFYGNIRSGLSTTESGDPSNNVELMLNAPVNDRLTLRAVAYRDQQGGYIDNVQGTIDASESARFRPAGALRRNGVPVSLARQGIQAGDDLSNVTFLQADNSAFVEDNFNETRYVGGRLSGLIAISDDWELLLGAATQTIDSDGVFFEDPDLDELQVQRFQPEALEDSFDNFNWTLTGRLAELELVYSGAYTDRETEQTVDYTDYLFVGQYLPYYICDYSVVYPGNGNPTGTCQSPFLASDINSETEINTHEIRLSTNQAAPIRATVGLFYSDTELQERNDFIYFGSTEVDGGLGFVDNFAFDTGFRSDANAFPEGTIFRNDVLRTDEQFGFFGEVTFDLSNSFALVLGGRYYDIEADLEGSANSSFCNRALFFSEDSDAFGTDISDLYNGDNFFTNRADCSGNQTTFNADEIDENTPANVVAAFNAPDTASTEGSIFKVTGNWTPGDNQLYYLTVSEGFRPGLLNRPGGASNGQGFTVPFALETDEVTNFELGWKTDWFDGTLRLNGNLFFVDIENLQTTIFDPSITNLFFSDNAADAEVTGLEGELIWSPLSVPGLLVSSSFSLLDTEVTEVITPTNDVREGDSLAYAPELQFNLQVRYEWQLSNAMSAHLMPHLAYSDSSYSDIITINRAKIDSWTMLGLTAGVSTENWSAELFVDNLTDERAELATNFVNDRFRTTFARPRSVGLRASYSF